MNRLLSLLVLAAVLACPSPAAAQTQKLNLRWRWVYATVNFQVNERVDELIALMQRARKAGYTGLMVTDFKWGRFADRPANYYANLKRTRQSADELGLEIIPCVMPVGYSTSILMNDPNLAEGIAVRDCPFVAQSGQATVADTAELLPGGTFDEPPAGNKFAAWDWMDGFGQSLFRDQKVKHAGAAAARMENFAKGNQAGNCRLVRKLGLTPWRQYHLSLWIKTDRLANPGDVRVALLTEKGRSLNFTELSVKATQDWTEHHLLLNPLEFADLRLYVGIWGGRQGTLWIDDLSLRQTAGLNLLRRDGCPIKVASDDGRTLYVEGRDFEPWRYDKMGADPYPGSYRIVHPAPPIVLKPGSRIRDGQRLKVSFYHTVVVGDSQVSGCLLHPDIFRYMEQQVRDVQKYFAPKKYFMSHDELRVAGQCELCRAGGKMAGEVLAENARRCTAMIHKVDPAAEIFVWSDMFDPFHNARDQYYLVGSTLKESWQGLDKDVRIANWNSGHRDESLPFFAGRGHKQIIAAYYDSGQWRAELDQWLAAARKAGGVEGVIYTTWENNYRDLEAFAAALPKEENPPLP